VFLVVHCLLVDEEGDTTPHLFVFCYSHLFASITRAFRPLLSSTNRKLNFVFTFLYNLECLFGTSVE
jgi:hypothetical protein